MGKSDSSLSSALACAQSQYEGSLSALESLCRIASVTSLPPDSPELREAALAVASTLREAGLHEVRLLELEGAAPYVYGEWRLSPEAPTLLVYGHYDVQPEGRRELWHSPPYEPERRGGRLFARGSADDKGGIMMQIAAARAYLKSSGKLPLTIKFLFEGEEEKGSPSLLDLIERERSFLDAEYLLVADSSNYSEGVPALTYRARGAFLLDFKVSCLTRPISQGMWGGAVPDAAMIACKLVARLTDGNGDIALPYFRERLKPHEGAELALMRSLPFDEEAWRRDAGLLPGLGLCGDPESSVYERLWARPCLALAALDAPRVEDSAIAITDSVSGRIVVRTVPDMDDREAAEVLIAALTEDPPFGARVEAKMVEDAPWWVGDSEDPAYAAALESLEEGYGTKPMLMGVGGSCGFMRPMVEALGAPPCLVIGVEDPRCGAHSENEGLCLSDWRKGIDAMIRLYGKLGELDKPR